MNTHKIPPGDEVASPVDAILRQAQSPTAAALTAVDLSAGFDDLLHGILTDGEDSSAPKRKRWTRRRRVVVSLAVAGGLIGTGGVATAAAGGALTGLFGTPGTDSDNSELVIPGRSDFASVAQGWARQLHDQGLRFAPGFSEPGNIDAAIARLHGANPIPGRETWMQETGVKAYFAEMAGCTWEVSWLDAHHLQDRSGMITASTGMRRTASLAVMKKVNAADHLRQMVDAADRGDAATVQTDVTLNCPKDMK